MVAAPLAGFCSGADAAGAAGPGAWVPGTGTAAPPVAGAGAV